MEKRNFDVSLWKTGDYDLFTKDYFPVQFFIRLPELSEPYLFAGVVAGTICTWTQFGCFSQHEPSEMDLILILKTK